MKIRNGVRAAGVVSLVTAAMALAAGLAAAAPPQSRASNLRLLVSGNGRYLVDQQGAPFLVLGDSPWSIIVQPDEHDQEIYLADRERRGFNSLIVNLLEHKFCTHPPNTRAGLAPFLVPGDFSTPNDAYFDYARQVVERAGQHGLVVWLAPGYLGYGGGDEGFYKEMIAGGREKLRAYGRYVGRRFRDLPNIVWMLGGDYTPAPAGQWVVNDLAEAIRSEDPGHLMTAHHGGSTSLIEAFGEQPWIAINNFYGSGNTIFAPMLGEFQRRPPRPFVLIETTYEGEHDSTPEQIRRQAYWAMLAGAGGQFFGNNPIWHFDGPGLYPIAMTWQQALDSPGAHSMTLLAELYARLPWTELAPEENHEIVTAGFGKDADTALTAVTGDGRLSVTYVPSARPQPRELAVALDGFRAPVVARWYNPAKGGFSDAAGSPFAPRGVREIQTPGDNGAGAGDWVLVLGAR